MVIRSLTFAIAVIATLACVHAQTPKPKPKPAQGGAVQLPGDNGKIGVPYQLGKKGEELVFTLEKAEFASRFFRAEDMGAPAVGKRLLILTYAVQNPSSTADRFFFNQSFAFTVVSPDDENFLCDGVTANGWAAYHPDRRDRLSMQLKPAQKVRALVAVVMHPKGPVNKVIVQRGKGTPVLRYDLKDKVAPMTGVFADNKGLDMKPVGSALMTEVCGFGPWDVTIEKCEDMPLPIGGYAPDSGKKFVVITALIKNASMTKYPLHNSLIITSVKDIDGGDLPQSTAWLKGSTPEAFGQMNIEPGAAVRIRILYQTGMLNKATQILLKDQQYSGQSVLVELKEPEKKPPII